MSKGSKILLFLLIIVVIVGAGFFIWRNVGGKLNSNNTAGEKINDNVLELSVKKALIEIANEEYYNDASDKTNLTPAEGHKILKAEVKDNQIYAYVVAEYGVYSLENNEATPASATATPIVLVFNMGTEQGYEMAKYLVPKDGDDEAWMTSLKEIFPEDLIKEATSIDYKDSFYRNQIESYVQTLKSSDTTNQIYKINGTNVSEEKAKEYAEAWNKKQNVNWSK